MKLFKVILLLLLVSSSCKKDSSSTLVTTEGVLFKPNGTFYMYGTHALQDNNGNIIYALKSSSIDLNNYVNIKVNLKGYQIDGYPQDGGPLYLNVILIEKK